LSALLAYQLAWRNLFRNKRRSLVTLLAVVIGIGSTIALVSFVRGLSHQMVKDAIFHLTGHIQIRAPQYRDDPVIEHRFSWPNRELREYLDTIEGANWAPRLRVPGVIVSERETRPITLVGIDPELERGVSIAGKELFRGEPLEDRQDGSLIVGDRLPGKLQSEVGRRVVLMSQSVDNQVADRGFRVSGTYRSTLETVELSFAFTGLNTLQEMLGLTDEISEISIVLEDEGRIDAVIEDLQERFAELETTSWIETEPMLAAITEMQNAILYIWYGIIVFAVAMGLMNTMFMAIYERIKEIALMKAIGTPTRLLFSQIIFEALILLFLGAILGTALGYLGFKFLEPGIDISAFATGAEMLGLSRVVYPQIIVADVVRLNIILFALGILSAVYPAWYASRREPLRELQ